MRALFRVDSGLGIGGGHLFRCLVLADELARRGWRCAFACRPHEGALSAEVAARGHELRQLAAPCAQAAAAEARHEAWIGADLEQDAAETRALVSDFRPDWLVADHYGLDARWEASARAGTSSALLVVDDLADRPHACDVLLDQNLWPDAERRYDGLLPEDCRTLLGPRFALLRGRDRTQEDVDPPSRVVLAFFGAEDPTGECSKLAAAWQARYGGEQASALELRIIAGRLNRDLARLEALAGRMEGLSVLTWVPDLAIELGRARCAIGAAGASTWERLAMGCESWIVVVAENQRVLAAHLTERGIARRVGSGAETTEADYRQCLRQIEDFVPHGERRAFLRSICDGLGAQRVAAVLESLQVEEASS